VTTDAAQAAAGLPEPFGSAVGATLAALQADPLVEAVILGGSLALGQHAARSDVDLVVIKSPDVSVMERYVDYYQDVQVQVIAGPPRQFDRWLELDRPQGTVLRQLAAGRLLFDRGGLGAHYQALARQVVERGLEPLTDRQILSRRFLITEMLDDVADCAADADQARWLMMTGLDYVVETAFLWRRRWTPKGKRALAQVQALDPELAGHCRAFLGGGDLPEQIASFRALAAHVLAPLGGELRERWARPPEAVAPESEGAG